MIFSCLPRSVAGGATANEHRGGRIVGRIVVGETSRVGLEVVPPPLDEVAEGPRGVVLPAHHVVEQQAGALRMTGLQLVVGEEGEVTLDRVRPVRHVGARRIALVAAFGLDLAQRVEAAREERRLAGALVAEHGDHEAAEGGVLGVRPLELAEHLGAAGVSGALDRGQSELDRGEEGQRAGVARIEGAGALQEPLGEHQVGDRAGVPVAGHRREMQVMSADEKTGPGVVRI